MARLRLFGGLGMGQVDQAVATKSTSSRLWSQMTPLTGDTLAASTTAEQTYASSFTVPANSLVVGQSIIIKGSGVYTTSALLPPTQRARVRLGGQILVDAAAQSFPISLASSRYMFDVHCIVRSLGVNGTVEAFGQLVFATSITNAVTVLAGPSGVVGDAGNPVTVDTTQPLPITLSCQFGGVLGGNSNSMRQISVHTLRPVT